MGELSKLPNIGKTVEEQLVQADETAIALYESQQEQETINAQQDEALMEIYEMLG